MNPQDPNMGEAPQEGGGEQSSTDVRREKAGNINNTSLILY